jgi:hypothetical protein
MATPNVPVFNPLPEFDPLDFSLESLEIEQFSIDPPEDPEGKYALRSDTSTNCCTDNCTIHCSDPCGTAGQLTCITCPGVTCGSCTTVSC